MPFPNRGGVGRPTMTSTGSLLNPQVNDVWTIVTPPGVEASDYSMMQDRGAGPVTLALTGPSHTVVLADIAPAGSFWSVTVRDLSINLVSLPINTGPGPQVPDAPTIGTATAGNGTVTGPYTAPASTGGSPITKYTAYLFDAGGNIVQTIDNAPNPVVFTGVPNGAAYRVRVLAVNAVGPGPLSAFSNAVTPGVVVPFMLATNRFVMATDFGSGDVTVNATFTATTSGSSTTVAFTNYKGSTAAGAGLQAGAKISGGPVSAGSGTTITSVTFADATSGTMTISAPFTLTAQSMQQVANYLSGNGVESTGRYHSHRRRFGTTWGAPGTRFLFSNVVQLVAGVVEGKTPFVIQRVEVRQITGYDGAGVPNASTLIEAIKFGGSGAHTMTAGERIWSDAMVNALPANGDFFLDVWWQVDLGNVYPSNATFNVLPGESSKSSVSTNLSLSAMATSGTSSAVNGSTFSATMAVSRGWDGSPCALIVGDSTEDLTNMMGVILTKDIGHSAIAYGSVTGGKMNYAQTARYSTALFNLYDYDHGPDTGGTTAYPLLDWVAGSISLLGQTRAPFQFIHSNHGRNSITGNTTLAGAQDAYNKAVTRARNLWPNIPWVQETIGPQSNMTNNSAFTDDTNVSYPSTQWSNTGYTQTLNNWILALGGGLFNRAVDTGATLRSPNNYYVWKVDAQQANLVNALAANSTGTITADAPFALGTLIVFEPGVTNVDFNYMVYAVRQNGANYDMDLANNDQRNRVYKNVTKAHAAGIVIKAATTGDTTNPGTHQSHKASLAMSDVIIADKAAITAMANAYTGS